MSPIDMTDPELLELLKADDPAAFNCLFSRYWDGLYRTALAKTGEAQAAFDIVQDIFVWLWQERKVLPAPDSLPQYLYGMVRNKVFNYYRTNKRRHQQLRELTERLSAWADAQDSSVDAKQLLENERAWDKAVNKLPGRMKEIYILRSRYQYSYRTIAETLNIKPQTVKNAFSRAQELLREHFSDVVPPLVLIVALNNLFIC